MSRRPLLWFVIIGIGVSWTLVIMGLVTFTVGYLHQPG
jgi:hypothetical protein